MSESTLVKQVRVLQKCLWHCLEVWWTSMISSEESHCASSLGHISEGPSTDGATCSLRVSSLSHEGEGLICLVHHGVLSACSSCSINTCLINEHQKLI